MEQQKLYTVEQVRQAMQESRYAFSTDKGYDEIIESLTPIELPSDEDIENYARQSGLVHPFITRGAKWMREQILNK